MQPLPPPLLAKIQANEIAIVENFGQDFFDRIIEGKLTRKELSLLIPFLVN